MAGAPPVCTSLWTARLRAAELTTAGYPGHPQSRQQRDAAATVLRYAAQSTRSTPDRSLLNRTAQSSHSEALTPGNRKHAQPGPSHGPPSETRCIPASSAFQASLDLGYWLWQRQERSQACEQQLLEVLLSRCNSYS